MERHNVAVHDDHHGNIHIYYRNWDGDTPGEKQVETIRDFEWYFLVDAKHKERVEKSSVSHLIKKLELEGDYLRVYCQNLNYNKWKREKGNTDSKTVIVKELDSAGIKTYEADLSSYQRYMLDKDIEMGQKFSVLYFDIETDDRGKGIEIGRDQIISFAAYDPIRNKTFYKSSENEAGLIKAMLKLFSKYDVMVGWNSEGFDLPYIRERARKFELFDELYLLMGVQQLDLMQKFIETYGRDTDMVRQFRSFKLENVSQHFLGTGKIPRYSTWEMFQKEPELLKEYNIRDVTLLHELEGKTGIIDMSITKAFICGARLNEKTSGRVLDMYILRAANKRGVHYRSVLKNVIDGPDSFGGGYVGGHVFTPAVGFHSNVHLLDFSSLYPSIIRTFNVSPETLLGDWDSGLEEIEGDGPFERTKESEPLNGAIGTPTNVRYKAERGVIPSLIHDLVETRNKMRWEEMPKYAKDSFEYKNIDKKQYIYKILANAMYGIIGAPFFRYYDFRMAESITRTGHYLTKSAAQYVRDKGGTVIYGDTDSIFVELPDGITPEHISEELKEMFNEKLKETFNVQESFINMTLDGSFDKYLIVSKKKYVGLMTDGKFKLTGFEAVKRDTIKVASEAQMKLFDMIIKNDSTQQEVLDFILELKEKIIEGKVDPEEITIYKKLTKHPKEFAAFKSGAKMPAHAQVYMDSHEEIEDLQVGKYVPFIITVEKPQTGVHPQLFDGNYARDYYWNTRVYALLKRVVEVAFPEYEWDSLENKPPKKERKPRVKKDRKVKVVGKQLENIKLF